MVKPADVVKPGISLRELMQYSVSLGNYTAEEAERIGLASRVLPAADFAAQVNAYAQQLAAGPPIGLTLAKRLLANSLDTDLVSQLRRELSSIQICLQSEDAAEAMRAFAEKRRPVFKGK